MTYAIAAAKAAQTTAPRFALPMPGLMFAATALALHVAPISAPVLMAVTGIALALAFVAMRDVDGDLAPTFAASASGALLALAAALTAGALAAAGMFIALSVGAIVVLGLAAFAIDGARGATTAAHATALLGGGVFGSLR